MTLANLSVFSDRALLATDSILAHGGRPLAVHDSKPMLWPHAHMMLATVGALEFRHALCRRSSWVASADDAAERLPSMAAASFADCRGGLDPGPCTVIAAGWSQRLGRVVGFALDSREAWSVQTMAPTAPGQSMHWSHPGFRCELWPDSPAAMFDFARLQLADLRRTRPGAAVGGSCCVVELTRSAMTVHLAGDLGLPSM